MFADLEVYKEEKQKFQQQLIDLQASQLDDKEIRAREMQAKFRDDIRKYLPTCLNIINNLYHCHFSIYKIGKDYDAAFRVIETNVKKTKGEIECELTNYRSSVNMDTLSELDRNRLDLATEIILTYVGDDDNSEKNKYLEHSRPVGSSIVSQTNTPMEGVLSSANEAGEIQYNPYANQPIVTSDQTSEEANLGIFGSNVSNQAVTSDADYRNMVDQSASNISGKFFSTDIFGVGSGNLMAEDEVVTNKEAMKEIAKNPNASQGMDLGGLPKKEETKKDVNDLLAPME